MNDAKKEAVLALLEASRSMDAISSMLNLKAMKFLPPELLTAEEAREILDATAATAPNLYRFRLRCRSDPLRGESPQRRVT